MKNQGAGFFLSCLVTVGIMAQACAPQTNPSLPAAANTPVTRPSPAVPQTTVPTPGPRTPTAQPAPAPAPSLSGPTSTPTTGKAAPKRGGVLLVATHGDPDTYDVHQETGLPTIISLRNVYEGLVKYDYLRHSEIVPELAERWDVSADGTVYTFRLRANVKWHDGRPFTADDAAYSLMRMAHPENYNSVSPRGSALLAALDKVDVTDPSTIRVTLKIPSASFLPSLATDWILMMPKHTIQAAGDMKRTVNGTGPFVWVKHGRGVSIELVKNKAYHDQSLPYLEGITFYTILDGNTRFAAFRAGRVRMTSMGGSSLTSQQAEILQREMADRVTVKEHSALARFVLLTNVAREPFNDPRVRQAVHLALDRKNLIKVDANAGVIGAAMPSQGAWGFTPDELGNLPGYRQPRDTDVAEAKRLLSEAGYGKGLKVGILGLAGRNQLAPVVQQQMATVGINIQPIEENVLPVVYERFAAGRFDLALFPFSEALDDPDLFFALYTTGSTRNYGGFSDKQIDELFQQEKQTLDVAQRKALVRKAQQRLLDLAVHPILFWNVSKRAWWNEVKDYLPAPGSFVNLKMDRVWLDR